MNARLRSQSIQRWQQRGSTRRVLGRPKLRSEGYYLLQEYSGPLPIGVHKRFGEDGALVSETHYDATGTRTRERAFREGKVTRDEEVFSDGSRKSYAH